LTILVIDAAGARAGVALVGEDGALVGQKFVDGRPGLIETLPVLLQEILDGAVVSAVAVTVGPGSFTGLRTALALAAGFGAAAAAPVWGVTVDEAYAQAFPALNRPLWVAVPARKGRLFLLRDGVAEGLDDADVPRVRGAVAVAGDAANEVAARLAAGGVDVMLTNARRIEPVWVARAALARREAGLAAHPLLPVYVDPPEAKLPAGGLRAAPV
jgi:tRNA threonylcarbamoyladenosine biosynthesis protein TsaB